MQSRSDWRAAAKPLTKLIERRPSDPYLKQQLALATYKSKEPHIGTALAKAKEILADLQPQTTTAALRTVLTAKPPAAWMAGPLNEQLGKLEVLLAATPPGSESRDAAKEPLGAAKTP